MLSRTYSQVEVLKDMLTNVSAAFIFAVILNTEQNNSLLYYVYINILYTIYAFVTYSLSVMLNRELYEYTRNLDTI